MKISTHWLRDFVELAPPLERIAERLTMAGLEVKKVLPAADHKDVLFEIEITTNRPDWLSHFGVAREIAAVENLSLKPPRIEKASNRPLPTGWRINLREAEGCPYYTGVYLEGITPVPTPEVIKERLERCGMRSINFLVDITNYVLLETGQPLHAFDADLLKSREIQVRRAKSGEPFLAINGAALKLESSDLVIADGEGAIALAGVMGGKGTEVNERTRNIFLESAFFHPRWVRQTSRRLVLASESSYRFERRVDPLGVDLGRDRAVTLIQQYAQPRFVSGVLKAGQPPLLPGRTRIHLTLNEIERRLGFKIKASQVSSFLTRLQLEVKPDSQESFSVAVPSFRADLRDPVDLIEEVARLYGYENIPETLPVRPLSGVKENPVLKLEGKVRYFLSGHGFYETVTFSLIPSTCLDPESDLHGAIQVNNPQNQDLNLMRPVLLPSLLSVVQRNQHTGVRAINIYEIANTYTQDKSQVREERTLGIAMSGAIRAKNWVDSERPVTFYDLKGLVCALFKEVGIENFSFLPIQKSFFYQPVSQRIEIGGDAVGMLGEVKADHLRLWDLELPVFFAQLSLARWVPLLHLQKKFQGLPRFPSVERDLALLVADGVKSTALEEEIRQLGKGLVSHVELFDLFKGGRVPKGYKNLAFRLTYQSLEKTLVSEEIQALHSEIAEKISKKFQATFQQ